MRAVMITRLGGPEVMEVQDVAAPAAQPGHVVVQAAVIGVNFRDTAQRRGRPDLPGPPVVAGIEGAGTVAEVGEGVGDVGVGDRVAWWYAPASYAEAVAVERRFLVRLPDDVDFDTAAATLSQGMTAHALVTSTYPVAAGDTVLVLAAAGGVGSMVVQMAKLKGARVIGIVSSEAKARFAEAAGADHVLVGYDEFDVRVRELTGGDGVAAVYDGIGGPTFERSAKSLRQRGVLAVSGVAGGKPEPFDFSLFHSSIFITRMGLPNYATTAAEGERRAADVFEWARAGQVKVTISERFKLAEAPAAHAALESRRTVGKLLLDLD